MLICTDVRTGAGCGAQNRDGAQHCAQCGRPLRYALQIANTGAIVGQYRVVRLIGHGGFGAVYQAEKTTQPGTPVALKETSDPDSIRAFQREFQVLCNLRHDNLPRYFDAFEADGNGYLVMEFVPGQSLDQVLEKYQGGLIESQVLGYALQLCDALIFLHGQNPPILHRDIKPDNVRLTPEGLIKLVDFGLVKQATESSKSSQRAGTMGYAPIEQYGMGGQHTSVRSDIYSLGATLYHLLTGQRPPAATDRLSSPTDLLQNPRQLNPRLSSHVSDAIMLALKPLPQERFDSARAFKRALSGQLPLPAPGQVAFVQGGVPSPVVQANVVTQARPQSTGAQPGPRPLSSPPVPSASAQGTHLSWIPILGGLLVLMVIAGVALSSLFQASPTPAPAPTVAMVASALPGQPTTKAPTAIVPSPTLASPTVLKTRVIPTPSLISSTATDLPRNTLIPLTPVLTEQPERTPTSARNQPVGIPSASPTAVFYTLHLQDTLLLFRSPEEGSNAALNGLRGYFDKHSNVVISEGELNQEFYTRKVRINVAVRQSDYVDGLVKSGVPLYSTVDGARIGSSWQERGHTTTDPIPDCSYCGWIYDTKTGGYGWPSELVRVDPLNSSLVDVIFECWVDERVLRL
ncbi:MAG: protein kinase [Anaerolineae bacterium]